MDPIVVETLRSIIRKDMRNEIEDMRNCDHGCSLKCQLLKRIADKELSRNQKVVDAMLSFQWCDTCSAAEPGAVSSGPCKKSCGQKLVRTCVPLMRIYGDKQKEIDELN